MTLAYHVLAAALLTVVLGGCLILILRAARRRDVLTAVAVGGALRLVVTAAAHIVSWRTGHHGFLYLDDRGYGAIGVALAGQWRSDHPPSLLTPMGIQPHGGFLFYDLLGLLQLGIGDTVIPLKLVNVVLGTATVLFSAVLAGQTLGASAARRTAWFVALAPTVIWWTAPMLKEAMTTAVLLGTLAAATYLPRPRAVVGVVLLIALLAATRLPIFVAGGASIALYLLVRAVARSRELRRLATPLAVAFAVVSLTTGGLLVAVTSSSGSSSGLITYNVELGREVNVSPDAGDVFDSSLVNDLAGTPVTEDAAALARFFVSPRAWAFAGQPLDWYQPLFPAMWLWYLLIPTAAVGLWRLRHRPELALIAGPILVTAAIYSVTLASGVRQRSAVEPLLVVLVVAGLSSARTLGLSAAAALALVAPFAALDLGSAPVGLAIAAVAAAIALITVCGFPRGAPRRPVATASVPPPGPGSGPGD